MKRECSNYPAFAEGQLEAEEVARFRQHLGGCRACRARLVDDAQIGVRLEALREGPELWWRELLPAAAPIPIGAAPPRARPPAWRRFLGPALTAAAAAAAILVVVRAGRVVKPVAPGEEDRAIARLVARLPERSIEGRLFELSPDRPLPMRVAMGAAGAASGTSTSGAEILAELGRMEAPRARAVSALLAGEARQASALLEPLALTPAVVVDRSVAALLAGEPARALALLDGLPAEQASGGPALWNRALALRDLGLTYSAVEAFARVALRGEPGWAAEAADRQRELQRMVDARRDGWREAERAGVAMVGGGPPVPAELARRSPGVTRLHFNDALALAASRDRVLALAPLAATLDDLATGSVLASASQRAAAMDDRRRASLAAAYRALLDHRDRGTPLPAPASALLARFRAAGRADVLAGALRLGGSLPAALDEYQAAARASGDPWLRLHATQLALEARVAQGPLQPVEVELPGEIAACRAERLEHRCAYLEHDLALVHLRRDHIEEARRVAAAGLAHATAAGEWELEALFLDDLATAARRRGDRPLERAYQEELKLRQR